MQKLNIIIISCIVLLFLNISFSLGYNYAASNPEDNNWRPEDDSYSYRRGRGEGDRLIDPYDIIRTFKGAGRRTWSIIKSIPSTLEWASFYIIPSILDTEARSERRWEISFGMMKGMKATIEDPKGTIIDPMVASYDRDPAGFVGERAVDVFLLLAPFAKGVPKAPAAGAVGTTALNPQSPLAGVALKQQLALQETFGLSRSTAAGIVTNELTRTGVLLDTGALFQQNVITDPTRMLAEPNPSYAADDIVDTVNAFVIKEYANKGKIIPPIHATSRKALESIMRERAFRGEMFLSYPGKSGVGIPPGSGMLPYGKSAAIMINPKYINSPIRMIDASSIGQPGGGYIAYIPMQSKIPIKYLLYFDPTKNKFVALPE